MGKHLTQSDRIKMETMLNSGHTPEEVAKYLGVHRTTVWRERKRGAYTHRNSDYTEEIRYSSDLGQKAHDWNCSVKFTSLVTGSVKLLIYKRKVTRSVALKSPAAKNMAPETSAVTVISVVNASMPA